MTWLTWRQHRIQALVVVLMLALLCYVFVRDGLTIHDYVTHGTFAPGLSSAIAFYLHPWLSLLVGVFIGAPLVAREREQRTHYLVWTQSITRNRWLAVKLALITGATLLAFGVLTIVTIWWGGPVRAVEGPWYLYNTWGPVLLGYAVFGLMLGVTVGSFIRRAVPAMALTFIILFVVSVALDYTYPYLIPPMSTILPISSNDSQRWGQQPAQLVLYAGYADAEGHETGEISQYCGFNRTIDDPGYGTLANKCIRERHLQWKIDYQPAERFWLLQEIETAILLALALALVPLTFWGLRKRAN